MRWFLRFLLAKYACDLKDSFLKKNIYLAVPGLRLPRCHWKWCCSVVSGSLQPHGLEPTRLLCPWDFPARILEWTAISFSRKSSQPRDWTQVSHTVGRFFTGWAAREVHEVKVKVKLLSRVQFFATPSYQAPPFMEFSRQEYWSGLPCPPPGDLPNPGIYSRSPALQADSLSSESPGKHKNTGMGSLSLLQGIFPTQESNQGFLHCGCILYQLSYQGSPFWTRVLSKWEPENQNLRVSSPFLTEKSHPKKYPCVLLGVGEVMWFRWTKSDGKGKLVAQIVTSDAHP